MALDEKERQTATWLAASRMGIGAALVVAPGLLRRLWIGDEARGKGTRVVIRAMGARDLALGAGTYLALADEKSDSATRTWLQVSGACDAVDAAATLLAFRRLPTLSALTALAAAASGAATSFRLAQRA